MLIAIDPGTNESGYAVMNGFDIVEYGIMPNTDLRKRLICLPESINVMAYEMIASYGMPVGRETFETCVWIGRFIEAFNGKAEDCHEVFRREVKSHLCNSAKAKDGNVRQAIIDKYPATGGGKCPQVGIKSKPGPLFGVSTHIWPAIGVGLTYQKL